jgi:hypothetical protein
VRHPKTKNRSLAERALVDLAQEKSFDRDAFDRVHEAWCQTESWQEKNGRFAPQLAEWISDRGYLRFPSDETSNGAAVPPKSVWSDYPEIKPLQESGAKVA